MLTCPRRARTATVGALAVLGLAALAAPACAHSTASHPATRIDRQLRRLDATVHLTPGQELRIRHQLRHQRRVAHRRLMAQLTPRQRHELRATRREMIERRLHRGRPHYREWRWESGRDNRAFRRI